MSLLDELANYSSVSSFFSEFTLQTNQLLSKPAQPNSYFSYNSGNATIVDDPISGILNQQIPRGSQLDVQSDKASIDKQYFENYRQKLRKMNSMVSILSAKTRKLKYQFMVHLERWAKLTQRQVPLEQNEVSNDASLSSKQSKDNKNSALLHAILTQIVVIGQKKLKQSLGFAFGRLNTHLRNYLKGQFLDRVVKAITQNKHRCLIKKAWEIIKLSTKQVFKPWKIKINYSKPISLNNKQRALVTKLTLDYEPLPYILQPNSIPNLKLPSFYPHSIPQESQDYNDNISLFMEEKLLSSQCMSITNRKTMDLSFSNNGCVSVFQPDRESSSQRSIIKQLSDVEMSAVPQSAFAKRKISDFTSMLAEHRANQNYSHVQIKKPIDPGLNLIKSDVNLHNSDQLSTPLVLIFQKDKQRAYNTPRDYCLANFSNDYHKECQDNYSVRRYSYQKERVVRSGSQVRMTHRQSLQAAKVEIDRDYQEQMKKYTIFKQYLQKRRESALKGIQKNQQILKKLMMKLEKSKQKVNKLKIQPRSKQSCSKGKESKDSLIKKLHLISKVSTPSKSARNSLKSHSKSKRNSINKPRLIKDSPQFFSLDEEEHSIKTQKEGKQQKNIDIYCKYMKEKKIMDYEKATPTKKKMKEVDEDHYSSKKQSAKADHAKIQKNILAISKLPQQRIDLKVNIGKSQSKKSSRGVQKDRLKLENGSYLSKFKERQSFK